ncbi:MAG: VIT1/CCC1 family protein [Tannerella sp.]|jgi:VIT1/CCC1 family predicted Fe2+/Mn2+ transporter|nr:VIT1/CCC1 family protein [Tannerella sp.]
MENDILKKLLSVQQDEITGYVIYKHLSEIEKNPENRTVLTEMANEEMGHYHTLEKYTNQQPKANKSKIFFYRLLSRFPGVTFTIKLLEQFEEESQLIYGVLAQSYPEFTRIREQEEVHENKLINMIKELKLDYLGSVILGMNDALIELTGALAGFTLALQDSLVIAMTGSITGIAAALSMASSAYLSIKADSDNRDAVKAAIITGISYLITVVLLIIPFLILKNVFAALAVTLGIAAIIIAVFMFYYSVVKEVSFKKRFLEMLALSFGIAAFSFVVGYILKKLAGV